MASPTQIALGAYDFRNDAFIAHPASPTGATISLNDGVTFTLTEPQSGSGLGEGLVISPLVPSVYRTQNPRAVGEYPVRRIHNKNRPIYAHLDWSGIGGTYAAWQTAVHNVISTLEGITKDNPGCLQIKTTGGSQFYYADVVEAHVPELAYRELLWAQQLDSITIEFDCRPYFRGPSRQYLQNLVVNPGLEQPSGGGTAQTPPTVFNDTFANPLNAYANNLDVTYDAAVATDAPVDNYKLEDAALSGTAADAGSGARAMTVNGTVTFRAAGPQGAQDAAWHAATFDGSTGYLSAAFNAGFNPAQWTIEAWVKATGGAGTSRAVFDTRDGPNNKGFLLFARTTDVWAVQVGNGTTTTSVGTGAVTLNAWTHVAATFDGTNVRVYANGVLAGGPTAIAYVANAAQQSTIGRLNDSAVNFFPGSMSRVALYSSALSATRVAAHYNAGILGTDTAWYPDTVMADSPVRYYRLDEAVGTTANDAARFVAGTLHGGVTLGTAGLLTGDTDAAMTFNGTTGYISAAATGLPSGNQPWGVRAVIKPGTLPSAFQVIARWGTDGANTTADLGITSANKLYCGFGGGTNINDPAVLVAGTTYVVEADYDGANLRLLKNGVLVAGPTAATAGAVGTTGLSIGANVAGGGSFYVGVIDEVSVYGADVNAHAAANNTAATNAPATVAQSILVPAGARASFGSANWGAVRTWQQRFRWAVGANPYTWYLHRADASNYLAATLTGTTFALVHVVAGVTHTLASSGAVTPVSEVAYWVQLTQFPMVAGNIPLVQAVLLNDAGNQPGTALATLGSVSAFDGVTALAGAPAFEAAGAALAVGGAFASVNAVSAAGTNTSNSFGPGGWTFTSAGTGVASGSWDWTPANTYPNGPVTSFACARIDAAPAGTLDAKWRLYTGGAPAGTQAIPIKAGGDVVYAGAQVKSLGLGNGATVKLEYTEYDASGAQTVAATALATFTVSGGVQAAYAAAGAYTLTGHWTTNAGTAYVDVGVRVQDATSGSAGGTAWIDNAQAWDSTTQGGQTTMPYCEMRSPNSPAQLVVSGIQGEVATPAYLAFATYYTTPSSSTVLTFGLGRRAQYTAGAQLTAVTSDGGTTNVLDATAYGGYYLQRNATQFNEPTVFVPQTGTILGTYHFYSRAQTNQSAGNLGNVSGRVTSESATATFRSGVQTLTTAQIGTPVSPITAQSVWTAADLGQLQVPIVAGGAQVDTSQSYLFVVADWRDSTGGGSAWQVNWGLLLPVDASILTGSFTFGSNLNANTNQYWWLYADGSGTISPGGPGGWSWSHETSALPSPAHSAPAVPSPIFFGVTLPALATTTDPFITLNPTLLNSAATSVNQFGAYITDQNGAVLALHTEMFYWPLYLYPK